MARSWREMRLPSSDGRRPSTSSATPAINASSSAQYTRSYSCVERASGSGPRGTMVNAPYVLRCVAKVPSADLCSPRQVGEHNIATTVRSSVLPLRSPGLHVCFSSKTPRHGSAALDRSTRDGPSTTGDRIGCGCGWSVDRARGTVLGAQRSECSPVRPLGGTGDTPIGRL